MAALDGPTALALWEEAAAFSPLDRAVRIAARVAGLAVDDAADLAVDERDRHLIAARRASFGAVAEVVGSCPACAARLEGAVDLDGLLALDDGDAVLDWDGRRHALRAPTSREVAAAACRGDPAWLAAACVVEPHAPPPPAEAVVECLAAARPLLEVTLAFDCIDCGATFTGRFDIGVHLWSDIERSASVLLDDVHRLATAYHWSEADILALTPARRAGYLARCTA